jgi:hypothetical protein
MKRICVALLVVVSLPLLIGSAQDKPMPPEQMQKLKSILGSFEGTATLVEGASTKTGKVRHTNTAISDGWGFLMDEIVDMEGGNAYKSHNIVGYDAGGGEMHVYSVTNAGETHDHRGKWTSPNAVSVQYKGKWEGKSYVEDAVFTLDGPDTYRLTWSALQDGKKIASGEEKLHRADVTSNMGY